MIQIIMKEKMDSPYVGQFESIVICLNIGHLEILPPKSQITYYFAIFVFFRQQLFDFFDAQQSPYSVVLILVPDPEANVGITCLQTDHAQAGPAVFGRFHRSPSLKTNPYTPGLVAATGTSPFLSVEEGIFKLFSSWAWTMCFMSDCGRSVT